MSKLILFHGNSTGTATRCDHSFGADEFINTTNDRFETALDVARASQRIDVVRFLAESGAGSGHLLSACRSHSFEEVEAIVGNSNAARADVEIKSVCGLTSLHYSTCSLKTVQLLCASGANPTITDEDGNTPLHFLVEGEDSRGVIQKLVGQGAKVNAGNSQGKTPLHHACIRLQPGVIECLLQLGADGNLQDNSGATPLHYAVMYYRLDVDDDAIEVLQQNALRNKRQKRGATTELIDQLVALEKDRSRPVRMKGYSKYVTHRQDQWEYLVCRALSLDWDIMPNDTLNPCKADSKEHFNIIKLLLCHANSADVKDKFDRTALHIASTNGYLEIAKYLIEQHRADINMQDVFGTNALHEAVSYGHLNVVKLFLESQKSRCKDWLTNFVKLLRCANQKPQCKDGLLNSQENYRGQTALHKAIENDNAEIIDELLSHGANVNVADFAGNTPIYSAVTGKRLTSVSKLLDAGAKIKVQNIVGNTLLHTAVAQSTSDEPLEIINTLLKPNASHGVEVNSKNFVGRTALHFAVWKNSTDMIRLLCDSGAEVNIADDYGNTPLHVMDNMKDSTMEILVDHGADINIRNNQGMTPLHVACLTRRIGCARSLLQRGADRNAVDGSGAAPLHFACCLHRRFISTVGFDPLVKLLLYYGADCNIQMNITGSTPLHVAGKQGDNLLLEQLVRNAKITEGTSVDVLGNSLSHCLSSFSYAEFIPPVQKQYAIDFPKNSCGLTWLHLNAKAGNQSWSDSIYAPFVETPDNLGRTALHLALSCGFELHRSFCGTRDLCGKTDFLGRNCFHHMCIAHNARMECFESSLKLACSHPELINACDIYGHTPLFYASIYQSDKFNNQLIQAGADLSMVELPSTAHANSVSAMPMATMNSSADVTDAILQHKGNYAAFTRPADIFTRWTNLQVGTTNSTYVKERTTEFVHKIMVKVAELDPLFASTPTLVGSALEGTRAERDYDEFDFMITLDKFTSLLDYSSKHDYFPTYVRLKSSDDQMSHGTYRNYIEATGVVQPIFVKERLYSLLIQACYCPDVWRNSPFEYLRTRLENHRYSPAVDVELSLSQFLDSEQRRNSATCRCVCIDIVPVVPTNWKLSSNTDFGMYVEDQVPKTVDRRGFAVLKPHKYSIGNDTNGYCPVTFIFLESEVIRQLPTVKAAYTMMKWLLFCQGVVDDEVGINKYALKTCVVQCVVRKQFRQETLHEVTENNLIHCIQTILQQLWRYVQNDAIPNLAMPEYDQPVWKFEPFAAFMKAYMSFLGMMYASDLYDAELRHVLHPLNVVLSDMHTDVIQEKKAKLIWQFRESFRILQKICELLSVEVTTAHEEHAGQVLQGISEERRRKLAHYVIRYNNIGNEFDLNENIKTLRISSPHLMTTNWTLQF